METRIWKALEKHYHLTEYGMKKIANGPIQSGNMLGRFVIVEMLLNVG